MALGCSYLLPLVIDKMEPGYVTESRTMDTSLLAAIAFGPQNLSLISDFLGQKVNANLHAKDNMGVDTCG
jgi:hypothetical protein